MATLVTRTIGTGERMRTRKMAEGQGVEPCQLVFGTSLYPTECPPHNGGEGEIRTLAADGFGALAVRWAPHSPFPLHDPSGWSQRWDSNPHVLGSLGRCVEPCLRRPRKPVPPRWDGRLAGTRTPICTV